MEGRDVTALLTWLCLGCFVLMFIWNADRWGQ